MADNFDNYGMKVQATASVKMPTASEIDKQIRNLEKSISKLQISGKLDDSSLKNLSHQLDTLKATVTTANFSPTALSELTNQVNRALQNINIGNINVGGVGNQAQQVGQQIGQQISQGVSQGIGNNDAVLNNFIQTLQRMTDMDTTRITDVADDIGRLGVTIESLNQSMSNTHGRRGDRNILSVDVSGVDQLGQAVTLTRQYNADTGELIRNVDAVSTATQKANSQLENLSAQQIKRQQDLRNQISQIYNSAIDPNASRSITDANNLGQLRVQYDAIQTAINNMGSASKAVFAEQEANVTSLITTLKNSVSEYKNAENVSTSLKPDKLAEGISKAQSRWKALNADIQNSGVSSEKLTQEVNTITSALSRVDNGGILSKAEVERVHTALTNAKNELTALVKIDTSNSSLETIRLQADTLKNKLDEFAKKNTGFADWTREVNNTTVSVETLKTELDNVRTASDLRVATARVNEFESAFKAVNATASKTNDITEKVNKIQLSTDITKIENDYKRFGIVSQEVENNLKELKIARENALKAEGTDRASAEIEKYNQKLAETKSSWKELQATQVSVNQRTSQMTEMQEWMRKNKNATKLCGDQVERLIKECQTCDKVRFDQIKNEFKELQVEAGKAGKLGNTLFGGIIEQGKKFIQWSGVTGAVMTVSNKVREAVDELKDLDDILTEITKTSDLTEQQLVKLGDSAYDTASKYGRTASDYLTGVQEMYRSGFSNAEEMAELSILAQSAGDMDKTLSNDYLLATNAAYKYKGSIEELNKVLDSQNYITNNAAISMKDIADATTETASVAAQYGVQIDELSALIATATANTRESGSEVGTALKAILINLQDTTSKPVTETFDALGISMTKVENGAERLKTPIELIHELADAYNSLPEGDIMRANILNEIGQKRHANTLAAVLSDMESYNKMLELYNSNLANDSAYREAEKSANNFSGSLNKLRNTWTDTVDNVLNSDTLTTGVNVLNDLLGMVNKLTDALGGLGTVGLAGGLLAGIKNVGQAKMSAC